MNENFSNANIDSSSYELSSFEWILIIISILAVNLGERLGVKPICYVGCIFPICISLVSKEKAMLVILITFINNRAFAIGSISLYTIITFEYFFMSIFKQRHNGRIELKFNSSDIFLLMFGIVQCFFYQDLGFFFTSYLKVILVLYFLRNIIQSGVYDTTKLWKALVTYLVIGTSISSIIAILVNPSLLDETRFSFANNAGENFAGIQVAIAAIDALILFLCDFSKGKRIVFVLCFFILSYIGVITASKTFLVTYVFSLVIISVAVIISFDIKTVSRLMLFIIIALIGIKLLISLFPSINQSITYIMNRLLSPKNDDVSNGRYDIWKMYYDVYSNNLGYLLFGSATYTNVGINKMAHNMYIELICGYGIIGTLFFTVAYCKSLLTIKKDAMTYSFWKKIISFVPIFMVLISGMSSHSLASFTSTM